MAQNSPTKFTLLHRFLHWAMAVAMPVLFITGFLRMYWMNKYKMIGIIEEHTNDLSRETTTAIATTIREPMWEWHEIFAKVMVAAFVVRIVYMLARGIRFPNPFKSGQPWQERFQGFTYVYFYLFVFISAVTGAAMEYNLLPAYHEPVETVHKWGIYWFPLFIALHMIGIVTAELSTKKGIISKMVGGD